MRFLYIVIICMLASVNVLAADPLLLDKDGFGGIKWGTEFSDELGMKECKDFGGRTECIKEQDQEGLQEIGGVPVVVKYIFYGEYFGDARITFDGAYNWPAIIAPLAKAYGKSTGDDDLSYVKNTHGILLSGGYGHNIEQRLGIYNPRNTPYGDASINRFDKMALAIFTGVERKELAGFLGMKWGDSVDKLPNDMLLARQFKNEKTYIHNKKAYFGFIPVDSIEYVFVNDKLSSVEVYSSGFSIYTLKDILELNFGKFEILHNDTMYDYQKELPKTKITISTMRDGDVNITATNNDPALKKEIEGE